MHKHVVTGFLAFIVMLAAKAETPQLLCLDSKNTVEETQCLNKELDRANKVLAEYLATAQAQINKQNSGKPQIAATQETWLKYRQAQCGDVYTYEEAGTYRYRADLECEIEATRSRTHEIWSAYMRTFGTSLPLLPEPGPVRNSVCGARIRS
jgi:uncharacterized protein YecT (DUF1311 family)